MTKKSTRATKARNKRSSGNPQTQARKVTYKGINFRSMLERDVYKLLVENKIPFAYEEQQFEIDEGFVSPNDSYEKFLNGKGEFKNRGGKKYKSAIYTPDFTPPVGEPLTWIIEVKGRAFPDFSRTWRLFKKKLLNDGLDTVCFVPRKIQDCIETIKIIKTL
tara:strand:+ start:6549 stop:7034 length:486 start_codon:yes stop_codon:yes gene_type:complete